jgi:hypothetical protein
VTLVLNCVQGLRISYVITSDANVASSTSAKGKQGSDGQAMPVKLACTCAQPLSRLLVHNSQQATHT